MRHSQGRDGVGLKKVGKYEVGRTIGEGTFAKVKFAKDTETGEAVAMKVLDKDKILKHKMVDQIKREISVMKLVRHPNVVRLYEVLASKSKIYIILEFVTGGELFDKIVQQGRLSEDESRKYFQQLIDAADFCHSRGVCHRDLKPENLLLDSKGNLKISDFGLSALPDQLRQDGLLHTTCGTPNYVAPEVLNDKGYNGPLADLWSCGVILYVLMAGFLPFDEPDLMTLYKKIQRAEFLFPSWFSPGAKSLIRALLNPNPKLRPSAEGIREFDWFRVGYIPIRSFEDEEREGGDDVSSIFEGSTSETREPAVSSPSSAPSKPEQPETMNAFELISMSTGLNLGVLFEKRPDLVKRSTRFASQRAPADIARRVEEVARELKFEVQSRNFKLRLERKAAARHGFLSVSVQIFEVAPGFYMVDTFKVSGDILEFHKFYKSFFVRLKELVWKSDEEIQRELDRQKPKVAYPRMFILPYY